eukprot:6666253-Alexandrium_andersonii.AAC.1
MRLACTLALMKGSALALDAATRTDANISRKWETMRTYLATFVRIHLKAASLSPWSWLPSSARASACEFPRRSSAEIRPAF